MRVRVHSATTEQNEAIGLSMDWTFDIDHISNLINVETARSLYLE